MVGGLGGILTIFLFGLVYYDGDVSKAGDLLILKEGLYAADWSAFGAFVAAPVGGLLFAGAAFALRIGVLWVKSRMSGTRFDAFDRPAEADPSFYTGRVGGDVGEREHITQRDEDGVERNIVEIKGKFF